MKHPLVFHLSVLASVALFACSGGSAGENEVCYEKSDCSGDLECRKLGDSPGSRPYRENVCSAKAGLDTACTNGASCAGDLVCVVGSSGTGVCRAPCSPNGGTVNNYENVCQYMYRNGSAKCVSNPSVPTTFVCVP